MGCIHICENLVDSPTPMLVVCGEGSPITVYRDDDY